MNADEKKYALGELEESVLESSKEERGIFGRFIIGLLYSVFGYLLGTLFLPFGAAPFGVAALCAADRNVSYIFVGLSLSAFGLADPIVTVSAYSAVLLIRILSRLLLDPPPVKSEDGGNRKIGEFLPELFSESVYLRMSTACIGVFIIGLYKLIKGGFLYYDLYGAVISMVAAPVSVILVYGIFNKRDREGSFAHFSAILLGFGVIFAARDISIYGISLAAFGAMYATLYICRKKGTVYGIAAGIVCGLAYAPIYAPIFIFSALAAGALWRVSLFLGSLSAFCVGMAWALYVRGMVAVPEIFPALMAASLLFSVTEKLFPIRKVDTIEKSELKSSAEKERVAECIVAQDKLSEIRLDAAQNRTKRLCETFSDISCFFYELGDKMKKPLMADIKQICDNAFDACCGNCGNRELCWEKNYNDTLAAVATISSCIHREGKVECEDIPSPIHDICERVSDITDEINHNYTMHTNQLLLCDRSEIFALDYEAISDLIAGNMAVESSEYECDVSLSQALCDKLRELSDISFVTVYGSRKRRVLIGSNTPSALYAQKEQIIKTVNGVCEAEFECEDIREDGGAVMVLGAKRRFCTDIAKRLIKAERESFCGDTVSSFENQEDRAYLLISDGMGSGRDAALTSGICAMFLQKMLSAANRCDVSLKMLNSFLRNKGGGSIHECSATVDLLELDLIYGKASFYKSGAAPTYVYRNGSLFKLRSKTVPIGIIKELDAKKISFDVGDGDVIVMISDGVTQGRDECPWLFELLKKNVDGEGIERTADMIVERAHREYGDDDISVIVIKVRENK